MGIFWSLKFLLFSFSPSRRTHMVVFMGIFWYLKYLLFSFPSSKWTHLVGINAIPNKIMFFKEKDSCLLNLPE